MSWSRNHKCCIECSTTETKHMAKGLCSKCYDHKRLIDRVPAVVRKKEKYRLKRKYKRIIQSVEDGKIWSKRLEKGGFVKVRSERTNRVITTPIKVKDIEREINNIRVFKKVVEEMRI